MGEEACSKQEYDKISYHPDSFRDFQKPPSVFTSLQVPGQVQGGLQSSEGSHGVQGAWLGPHEACSAPRGCLVGLSVNITGGTTFVLATPP